MSLCVFRVCFHYVFFLVLVIGSCDSVTPNHNETRHGNGNDGKGWSGKVWWYHGSKVDSSGCSDTSGTSLRALVNDILEDYDPRIIPRKSNRHPVLTKLTLRPYQLIELSEVEQYIKLSVWMIEEWNDDFLYTDPSCYDNGQESIKLPVDEVWRPDTYLYNSLEMEEDQVRRLINVKLTPNTTGQTTAVTMQYPAQYKVSCKMNVEMFPFDQQNCSLLFGSWTHDTTEIDFIPTQLNVTMKYLIEDQEWDFIGFWTNISTIRYDCCPNPYKIVNFNVILQRKPLFYTVNLVIPCAIVTIINFVGFFTPSSSTGERTEKISLGLTTLLALGVLLLQLSDHTPRSSNSVSLIGWYILGMIALVGMGSAMTGYIIYLSWKANTKHPSNAALDAFVKYFGWLGGAGCRKGRRKRSGEGIHNNNESAPLIDSTKTANQSDELLTAVNRIHDLLETMESEQLDESKWETAANSLERLCLFVYIIGTVLLTVWLFEAGFASQVALP